MRLWEVGDGGSEVDRLVRDQFLIGEQADGDEWGLAVMEGWGMEEQENGSRDWKGWYGVTRLDSLVGRYLGAVKKLGAAWIDTWLTRNPRGALAMLLRWGYPASHRSFGLREPQFPRFRAFLPKSSQVLNERVFHGARKEWGSMLQPIHFVGQKPI